MTDDPGMTEARPVWIDLATSDDAGAREFYSRVFGWQVDVTEDPQYGGYALARIGGRDVAGIGPKQSPEVPTAWSLYIGTDDVDGLAARVPSAGGTVVVPPFDVGDQGRMAVLQDPSGAFISAWQSTTMGGFGARGANTFGWAELNARGLERATPFYESVFGWTPRESPMGEGERSYTEFVLDGESVAGAWEMDPAIPDDVPSYWQVYFTVDDVDDAFRRSVEAGATAMVAPQDFPGGRFAIVTDPQGASFGLLRMAER
jgi:uncharacterized protein